MNGIDIVSEKSYCIVRLLKEQSSSITNSLWGSKQQYSNLVTWGDGSHLLYVLLTRSIVGPALVVPNIPEVKNLNLPKRHRYDLVNSKGAYFVLY